MSGTPSDNNTVSKEQQATKPRAKSTAFSFYVKFCKETSQNSNPGNKVSGQESAKKYSEEWKKMSETDKADFKCLAEKDKERFEREMAIFNPSSVEKRKRKRSSKEKDPNAPKKPLGAFLIFSSENRNEVKEKNPNIKNTEVAKHLGSLWNELPQEEKDNYKKQAVISKEIYEAELEKYNNLKAAFGDEEKENESNN